MRDDADMGCVDHLEDLLYVNERTSNAESSRHANQLTLVDDTLLVDVPRAQQLHDATSGAAQSVEQRKARRLPRAGASGRVVV
jgi:hypothetical protein